jgi:hypothetical protein
VLTTQGCKQFQTSQHRTTHSIIRDAMEVEDGCNVDISFVSVVWSAWL